MKCMNFFTIILVITSYNNVFSQSNTFPSSGNVGIGVLSPATKLQVEGDINSTGNDTRRIGFVTIDNNNGVAHYGLTYKSNGYSTGAAAPNDLGPGVALSGYYGLSFLSVGTERMRIDKLGNVGIGKVDPQSILDVNGEITALAIKGPSDLRFKKYTTIKKFFR